MSACAAARKLPPPGWTKLDQSVDSVFSPSTRGLGDSMLAINSLSLASADLQELCHRSWGYPFYRCTHPRVPAV